MATPLQRDEDTVNRDKVDSQTTWSSGRGSPKRAASAGRLSARTPPERQTSLTTSEKLKLREIERFEKSYKVWQQAKKETRQGQYKHYKEKIALQHELIRAQDELASQKREKEQQELNQHREEKKANKQARDTALQNICRQSLDDDRRSAHELRKSKNKQELASPAGQHVTSMPKATGSTGYDPSHTKRPITGETPGKSILRTPSFRTHCLSPCLAEDDEIGDDEAFAASQGQGKEPSLPWHHTQLYRLYGNKADYFLHPKIEPKPQKHVNPKLRRQGGRAGADILWETLRNESRTRLHQDDKNVSAELKVPDMSRLLDHSRLHQARAFRHKLEIMHRSSQTNEDRTRIHIFNNPIPDLNNLNGEDSIARYLPSWMDDESEASKPEYIKWLSMMQSSGEGDGQPAMVSSQVLTDSKSTLSPTQDEILAKIAPKPVALNYPRLRFMTEQSSRTQGNFSHKFKEKRTMKDIPTPYENGSGDTGSPRQSPAGCDVSSENTDGCRKRSSQLESDPAYTTPWQPLSMLALMEYQDKMSAKGDGDFNQGRASMWQTTTVAS